MGRSSPDRCEPPSVSCAALVHAAGEGILLADEGGIISLVNDAACTLFARHRAALVGQLLETLICEGDRPAFRRGVSQVREAGRSAPMDLEAVGNAGARLPVSVSLCCWQGEDGHTVGCIVHDRTSTVQFAQSDRELASIVEFASEAIVGLTTAGVVTEWNRAAAELFGYGRYEMVGQHVSVLIPPDRMAEAKTLARQALGGESVSAETVRLHRSGARIEVSMTLSQMRNARGAVTGTAAIIRDARAGRREQELAAMAYFADLNPFPMLRVGADGNIIFTNDAARCVFGQAARPGSPISAALPGLDRDTLAACVKDYTLAEHEHRAYGRIYSFSIQQVPSLNAVHLYGRDVTEQRHLARKLEAAGKLEALGSLAGGIAHDFNNLLMVIGSSAQFLLERFRVDDPMREEALAIDEASQRAAELTAQLLAFSRRKPQVLDTVNLNQVIRDMVPMLHRLLGEDIELVVSLARSAALVRGDVSQIEQVLMNLVVNARDALPGGGSITVRVSSVPERVGGRALRDARGLQLEVTDNGTGISPDIRARIFDPFFSTKPEGSGTGLGLSTVFGIVAQHGGAVSVDSEPGRGSTFKVVLPVIESTDERVIEEEPGAVSVTDKKTVLLVEDKPLVRRALRRMLERNGCLVVEADCAETALVRYASHAAEVDLLLTDVVMPGMSGPDLAEKIGAQSPEMCVLFVSGHTEDKLTSVGLDSGRVHFLPKPFTPDVFAKKLGEVWGSMGKGG